MTFPRPNSPSKVNLLPPDMGTLARGLPPAEPGTLFVLGVNGGVSVSPDAGFKVVFGRNDLDVHVCVGADDQRVSRRHGYITREHSRWVLYNTGKLPIRFPSSRLVLGGYQEELPTAYTPLFIVGPKREHLMEVRVATKSSPGADDTYHLATLEPLYELNDTERLVIVCLAQRYLRQERHPQPLAWGQAASELSVLRPGEKWGEKRLAWIVTEVRRRLSGHIAGVLAEEVPQPVGNALNHNLIMGLLVSSTISRADLRLLDG